MKRHLFALSFIFAAVSVEASVRCQSIPLNTLSSSKVKEVVLTQKENFDENQAFDHYLSGQAGAPGIKDLKVEILKADLFDDYEQRVGGFVTYDQKVKVFAVKTRLSSKSTVLGSEFSGCIPHDKHEIVVHTLCEEIQQEAIH